MRLLAVALIAVTPHVTHDVIPVLVPTHSSRATVGLDYTWGGGGGVMPKLAAMSRPRTIADQLPPPVRMFAHTAGGDAGSSHLLLANGLTRIFAFAGRGRQICFIHWRGGGLCLAGLQHGAYATVDVRRDVWGIVDDEAVRVDVIAAGRTLHARLGHNAFFLALQAIPNRIVVRERDRSRHVYDVKRCKVSDISPLQSPLAPPC